MAKVGRPLMYETPEELEQAIQGYFDTQILQKQPITITGLAYFLGFTDRQSIYDYKEKEQFTCIIKKATFFVESQYENKLHSTTPTGAIFALKNMGWRDKVETGFTNKEGQDIPIITGTIVT